MTDLYGKYYSKECISDKVLPYLDKDGIWVGARSQFPKYGKICSQFADYNEDNDCFIFSDVNKLFEFAKQCPEVICDYITEEYSDTAPIFILWRR